MPMTGDEMRELRAAAGYTQAELADRVGLSRKTINEAETLGHHHVERRTEVAVRAITLAAKARSGLRAAADRLKADGDVVEATVHEQAAILLSGDFVTDETTMINLALTAARLRLRLEERVASRN